MNFLPRLEKQVTGVKANYDDLHWSPRGS